MPRDCLTIIAIIGIARQSVVAVRPEAYGTCELQNTYKCVTSFVGVLYLNSMKLARRK